MRQTLNRGFERTQRWIGLADHVKEKASGAGSGQMGHRHERTTEEIYRHAIGEERLTVRNATIKWPGLNG